MSITGSLPRKWSMPQDLRLVEHLVELGVERPRRGEVVAERLLDHDPRALGQPGVVRGRGRLPNSDGGISR